MRIIAILLLIATAAQASEPWTYIYRPRFFAIYKGPYGSQIQTRINDDQFWAVPHHQDCYVSPVNEVRGDTFSRTIMCVDKSTKEETSKDRHKQVICKAKAQEFTECEAELEGIRLVIEIRRYLDGRSRMYKNVEKELKNKTPY